MTFVFCKFVSGIGAGEVPLAEAARRRPGGVRPEGGRAAAGPEGAAGAARRARQPAAAVGEGEEPAHHHALRAEPAPHHAAQRGEQARANIL